MRSLRRKTSKASFLKTPKTIINYWFKPAVFLFALAPLFVQAGGDEVVVIYNSRVRESRAVAEYYAKMRQVPAKQIFGFALTTNERMPRDEFRDSLQLPLARRLADAGLWQFGPVTKIMTNGQPGVVERRIVASQIRYAVLCYGVPLGIEEIPGLSKPGKELPHPELQRDEASVDSELAWLPLVEMGVSLPGALRNWIYGTTNIASLNPTNGILLIARLDGPSADIARGLVDKALAAERDGLWGRTYFDTRGLSKADTNYYLGDAWMLSAAKLCNELGFETTVDRNPGTFPTDFPMSQIAIYCGWYDGAVSGPFTLPKVEFMPGAFAYHLHSFSAATVRSTNENWVGPLLAKGAACTMGCVNEPYLALTPNVAAFLARWIPGGFTFGEAAWAAQPVLSWQTTVVGDPLYRPFGMPPQRLLEALTRRHSSLTEWSYLRLVNLDRARGLPIAQLADFLENLDITARSAVLTEKLADLYQQQGKPSSSIEACQRALTLNASPEQRIRIRLMLGEKLLAQRRETDALENYRQLLKASPDYPGRPAIEAKLAALEQKSAASHNPAAP